MTTSSTPSHPLLQTEQDDSERIADAILNTEREHELQDTAGDPKTAVVDSVEHRVNLIAEALSIFDERAWFLAAMFDHEFYAANYNLKNQENHALFTHFLTEGIRYDFSPSPAFDPIYTNSLLPAKDDTEEKQQSVSDSVFYRWLNEYYDSVIPHALFDPVFYRQHYEDIAETVKNPYAHFATTGLYENRTPCHFLQKHIDAVYSFFDATQANIRDILSGIPAGSSAHLIEDKTQVILKKIFMPEFYQKYLDMDTDTSIENLYSHFLVLGCFAHYRPTLLFNESWYLEQLNSYTFEENDTDTLREFSQHSKEQVNQLIFSGTSSPFLHWFFNGMKLDIIPTPLFDTEMYQEAHPDIRSNWPHHPFMHFIETGHKERFRRHSVFFNADHYQQQIGDLKYSNALLDFTLRGQLEEISPAPGLRLEYFTAENALKCSTLEEAAIYFNRRLQKLKSATMSQMIEKATALEPRLVRPYGSRLIRMAPVFNPETDLMHNMRNIVPELKKTQYDIIILMPHCRMAGSANVAGQFTTTLSKLSNGRKILIITTDLSAFERPDWFPENVDVYDLSHHIAAIPLERKIRILLDLIRGLRPKKIVNINSNLGWRLTSTFGKQISAWMDIYFYLFCWDRDKKGNKGGYPIEWFLPTFNYAKAVFTDNTVLRTELQDRYCLTPEIQKKIVTLHTPATQTQINYKTALAERSTNQGVRRIFWSGRFDKQKRIDVLFAIAKRLPDIEFWVWGKKVLNDSEISMNLAPENIRLMGTYTSIDDLPIASCDCFLYTSGWDGLPIILIDVASRGIPIVASAVGGVSDLITTDTGWPVDEYANPDAYCNAIETLLGNYPNALEKGQRGRDHALALCNESEYNETLKKAMKIDELYLDCKDQTNNKAVERTTASVTFR